MLTQGHPEQSLKSSEKARSRTSRCQPKNQIAGKSEERPLESEAQLFSMSRTLRQRVGQGLPLHFDCLRSLQQLFSDSFRIAREPCLRRHAPQSSVESPTSFSHSSITSLQKPSSTRSFSEASGGISPDRMPILMTSQRSSDASATSQTVTSGTPFLAVLPVFCEATFRIKSEKSLEIPLRSRSACWSMTNSWLP